MSRYCFNGIDKYILTIANLTYTGNDYKNKTEKTIAANELLSYIIDKTISEFSIKALSTIVKSNLCYIFVTNAGT